MRTHFGIAIKTQQVHARADANEVTDDFGNLMELNRVFGCPTYYNPTPIEAAYYFKTGDENMIARN